MTMDEEYFPSIMNLWYFKILKYTKDHFLNYLDFFYHLSNVLTVKTIFFLN